MAENAIKTRRRAIQRLIRKSARRVRLGQVEMPAGDIPEAWEANNRFFDALAAASSRSEMDAAAATYRQEIDDLRARGIITTEHRDVLAGFIPMHVNYADAKRTGEVGPEGKKGYDWALEKGYITEPGPSALDYFLYGPLAPYLYDWFPFLPESIVERTVELYEKAAKVAKALGKVPWWAWAGGAALGLYVIVKK